MFARIWNLAGKEFIQLRRDRLMTACLMLFPVAQLMLLAMATGQGVKNLSLAALMEEGRAAVGIVIPAGFAAALTGDGRSSSVQVIVDGSNTVAGSTGQAAVEGVRNDFLLRPRGAGCPSVRPSCYAPMCATIQPWIPASSPSPPR